MPIVHVYMYVSGVPTLVTAQNLGYFWKFLEKSGTWDIFERIWRNLGLAQALAPRRIPSRTSALHIHCGI